MRGGAARRRAHEATVAAGAWAGHPPSASAATAVRTLAVGPKTIALRLSRTLKYTGMGSMGHWDARRRSPSACSRSNCCGRGGAGQPRPFRSPRQGAARRRAQKATVAAGAGAGQPRSASAATTFRTFAVGPTTIALRLLKTLKYTGMDSMEPWDARRRSPSACSRSNCRGRGGGGTTSAV